MLLFLRYPNYVNYIQDLLGAQGLKSKSYIKKIIVVEIIKNLFMSEYVSAIATAAVASATARFPLYTIWNVSKYENFFSTHFPIFGLNTEICGVNIRIKSEYGNIRNRKNSISGYFSRSVIYYSLTVDL